MIDIRDDHLFLNEVNDNSLAPDGSLGATSVIVILPIN